MPKKFVKWKRGKIEVDKNLLGRLGESIVKSILEKEGFKVKFFDDLLYRKKPCSKISKLIELCRKNCPRKDNYYVFDRMMHCVRLNGKTWSNDVIWDHCKSYLSKYCFQVCKRLCRNRKVLKILEEVSAEQKDERRGSLDFVAYRGKEIWVVEVKTGKHSELDASQRKFVERLRREMGIGCLHFHVDLPTNEIEYLVRLRKIEPIFKGT